MSSSSEDASNFATLERFRFIFLLLSPLRWKVILKREALKNLMENTGKAAGDASLRSA